MKHVNLMMITLLIVSCSKVEKTSQNSPSMEKAAKGLTEVQTRTRSQNTQENRSKNLKLMKEARGMGEKINSAAAYFKSFEFQSITESFDLEDELMMNDLLLSAANEFTRTASDLYGRLGKFEKKRMGPTKKGFLNQDEMNFYALAATLHMNGEHNDGLVESEKSSKESFYDMIKRALIRDGNGQRLDAHEEVLVSGKNKEVMIELFKARVDILAANALQNLTDKKRMSSLQKLEGLLFFVTNGFLGAINLPETYNVANEATKKMAITLLSAAVKTKQLLQELSYPYHPEYAKKLEKTIRSAFEHIEMKTLNDEENALIYDDRKEEIRLLINQLL